MNARRVAHLLRERAQLDLALAMESICDVLDEDPLPTIFLEKVDSTIPAPAAVSDNDELQF